MDACVLYVPASSIGLYAAAEQWCEFVNIEAIPVDYALEFEGVAVKGSKVVNLPVRLVNAQPAITFICDIEVPDGLEVVRDGNGAYDLTKGDRMSTQVLTTADVDGKVRVLSYSMTNAPYAESDGVLFYLPLRLADPATEVGTVYTINVTDVLISTDDLVEHAAPNASATVTVERPYTPGDVNDDGCITPLDIAMTVSKVMGGNPAGFIEAAADMNQDGRVTPVDIAHIVSIILGSQQSPAAMPQAPESGEASAIALGGDGTITVGLSGIDRFTALQMDVELPAGVGIDALSLTAGDGHALKHRRLDNGLTRILVYSMANDPLPAEAQLSIALSGANAGNIAIGNILATERTGADEFAEYSVAGCSQQVSALDLLAADSLSIQTTSEGLTIYAPREMTLTVADMLGRVRHYDLAPGRTAIPLPCGIYLVNNQKVIIK